MEGKVLPTIPSASGKEEVGQIRVVLIEDDTGLRDRLESAVRSAPALKWLAGFGTAEEALQNIVQLSPDVVVVDLNLPGMAGVPCIVELKQLLPDSEVLVLTAFDDNDLVLGAIKAGARGYLIKRSSPDELLQSIQDVWNGGAPMNPVVARKVLELFAAPSKAQASSGKVSHQSLTKREEEILQLLAQGSVVKEIPDILKITEFTVRFHLRHIYKKFHVNNQTQAVIKYLER